MKQPNLVDVAASLATLDKAIDQQTILVEGLNIVSNMASLRESYSGVQQAWESSLDSLNWLCAARRTLRDVQIKLEADSANRCKA